MADIEERAEAEAAHKGLTGQARKSYIGGVWNRIRQAHAKGTQPGGHAVPRKLFNRRARQQAREDARNAMRPHQEAISSIKKGRDWRLSLHRDEQREEPRAHVSSEEAKQRREGTNLPQLQPDYQPTERDLRGSSSLVHAPDEAQGTIRPAPGERSERRQPMDRETRETEATQRELDKMSRRTKLVPIKEFPGYRLDATRAIDPEFIKEYFGDAQLRTAFEMQPTDNLQESVDLVRLRHPGTAPKGTSKKAMIDYIVQSVKDAPATTPKPARRSPFDRRRDKSIADAVAHGAPEVPPQRPAQPATTQAQEKLRAKERALQAEDAELEEQFNREVSPGTSHAENTHAIYVIGARRDKIHRQLKDLRTRIRTLEGSATPQRPAPAARTQASEASLTPIVNMEGQAFDPSAPIDPYLLKHLYGDAQLHTALERYTAPRLSEAVRAVQARHPGTRPASGTRPAMIAYIEQHVKDAPAAPAAPPSAPEPSKASYREEQFRRKHQFRFEQGERDRQRKAEQDARAQRNITLKQAGYKWEKVQDIGGPSDDGDNAAMVWQLYDPQGKPVSEAEALRRIQQK